VVRRSSLLGEFGEWQIADDNNAMIARCDREDVAREICDLHNQGDPIQTYEDWLYWKEPC
jgi:hypothetical protein